MAQQHYDPETAPGFSSPEKSILMSRVHELFASLPEIDTSVPLIPVTTETRPVPEHFARFATPQIANVPQPTDVSTSAPIQTDAAPAVPPPLPENIYFLSQHAANIAQPAEEGLRNVA